MNKFIKNPWLYIVLAAIITTAGMTVLIMSTMFSPADSPDSPSTVTPSDENPTLPEPTPTPEPSFDAALIFPQIDSSTARKDMVTALSITLLKTEI